MFKIMCKTGNHSELWGTTDDYDRALVLIDEAKANGADAAWIHDEMNEYPYRVIFSTSNE